MNELDYIFKPYPDDIIKLDDIVVVYSDGNNWKIIPQYVLSHYVIFYDNITETINNTNKTINCTIVSCPNTDTIALYKEHLTLLSTKKSTVLSYDTNKIAHVNNTIDKDDVYRDTLRNILKQFHDCMYLHTSNDIQKTNINIINPAHGIEYTSKNIDTNGQKIIKHILISHKNKTINNVIEYIHSINDKISEKEGVIIPTTEQSWIKLFPQTKIVKL